VNDDLEPVHVPSAKPEPRWESDVEEREARRRKMFVFGSAAVAVLFGFVGLYAGLSWIAGSLTDDPTPEDQGVGPRGGGVAVAPEPADPAIDVAPAQIATADELDWYAIEAPLGHSERLFATASGAFYALSTVPGQNVNWPPPKAIYKSGDGENWEIIPLDNDNSANDMAADRGSLYLIGTAPGTGNSDEPAQIVVSASQDEGENWSTTLLPTVAAPPGGAPIEWTNLTTTIAASDEAVVAVVQSQFFLDYRQIVPTEFAGEYGYSPRAEGVDVIDHRLLDQMYMNCEREMEAAGGDFSGVSEDCRRLFEEGDESFGSIAFITWEEMGLPEGGEPVFSEMFVTTDGITFEAVESPFTAGSEVSGLFGLPDGFLGVESDRGRTVVWRSDDGRTWEQAAGMPDFGWVTNAGAFGDRAVVMGQAPQGDSMVAWSSEDWSLIPIDEITGMSGGYSNWVAVGNDRILVRYDVYTEFRPLSLQVMGVATN
jgi:hypothetical protein